MTYLLKEVADYDYYSAAEVGPLDKVNPCGFVNDFVQPLSDFPKLFIAGAIRPVFFRTELSERRDSFLIPVLGEKPARGVWNEDGAYNDHWEDAMLGAHSRRREIREYVQTGNMSWSPVTVFHPTPAVSFS